MSRSKVVDGKIFLDCLRGQSEQLSKPVLRASLEKSISCEQEEAWHGQGGVSIRRFLFFDHATGTDILLVASVMPGNDRSLASVKIEGLPILILESASRVVSQAFSLGEENAMKTFIIQVIIAHLFAQHNGDVESVITKMTYEELFT